MRFTIYVIEDSIEYHDALKFELEPQLIKMGFTPNFIFKTNHDSLQQDLIIGINILLIDDDLGNYCGSDIIAEIDSDPECKQLPIIYYSGGETIERLKQKTEKFGHVICCTKNTLVKNVLSCCSRLNK